MAHVSLIAVEDDTQIELTLIRENKPTALFAALAAAEIALDILIAYAAYRIMRA